MNDKIRQTIVEGDLEGFKKLVPRLEDIPQDFAVLFVAAYHKKQDILRYLVEGLKMDIDSRTGQFMETSLAQLSYKTAATDSMRLLIASGADVNAKSGYGDPVLFDYIRHKNIEGLEILKEHNVNLKATGKTGASALMIAVAATNLELTKWLLANGADPAAKDEDGLNVTKYMDSDALRYVIDFCREHSIELEDTKRLIPLIQIKKWINKTKGSDKVEVRLDGSFDNIPEEIAQYPEIKVLTIANNRDMKRLDPAVFSLPNLEELTIINMLSLEEIPKDIKNLKELKKLDISYCGTIKSLPDELYNLANLEELTLQMMGSLNEIPVTISGLKKLKKLEIGKCENIFFVPDEICELRELEFLALYLRYMEYLPANIGNLTKLKQLHVYDGAMQFTPASMRDLKNLTHLTLANQDFDLSEMDTIFYFPLLKELNLQNNDFETIPRKILELKNLKKFIFQGNPITNPPIKKIKGGFKGLKQYFLDNPE
jgi:Leucine-rich repeat (LRR) protein